MVVIASSLEDVVDRMDRDPIRLEKLLDTDPKPFGSADYGKEELVAEMAAAFLCGHAGIKPWGRADCLFQRLSVEEVCLVP